MTGTYADRTHTMVDSPVGVLTLVAEGDDLVGLYMERQRHRPVDTGFGTLVSDTAPSLLAEAARQLAEYFAGARSDFSLPLALHGTRFQLRVWAALREIPYGRTCTYGQLAERIGYPGATRAVGLANGRNPIGVIVPCHRVIGADGSLRGYGGGLERKRILLALEHRASRAPFPGVAAGLCRTTHREPSPAPAGREGGSPA